MHACNCETERGFFEGVCAPTNASAYFSDPPPLLHDSRIVRDSVYFRRLRLEPIGTHDQALLEGGDRSARLQRDHVPPPHPPHHPRIGRVSQEDLADPILISTSRSVPEHDPVALLELTQIVEEHAASGPPKAHAVSCQVDVPLWGLRPRQGGFRDVGNPLGQRLAAIRVEDGGAVDAYLSYGEGHYGPWGQFVVAGSVGGLDLSLRGPLPVVLPRREGSFPSPGPGLAPRFACGSLLCLGPRAWRAWR